MVPGCENQITSPDGRLTLRIDAETKNTTLWSKSFNVRLRAVDPPAMISWSPNSDAFFINDGEGSGQTSLFRLFRIRDSKVVEDPTLERNIVGLYRSVVKCSDHALDPDVWGLGWSVAGKQFYVIAQATIHRPCGLSDQFMGLTVNLSDASISDRLSTSDAQTKFRALLPRELLPK
jgi:hypothetical protein